MNANWRCRKCGGRVGPRRELESCEGAVGAWGDGVVKKTGCSGPGASEESLLQGGRSCGGAAGPGAVEVQKVRA